MYTKSNKCTWFARFVGPFPFVQIWRHNYVEEGAQQMPKSRLKKSLGKIMTDYFVLCVVIFSWELNWYLFQIVQWQTFGRRSGASWRSRPTRRAMQKRIGSRRKWWSSGRLLGSCKKNCCRRRTWKIQKSRRQRTGRAAVTRFFPHFLIQKRELCLILLPPKLYG